MSRLRDLREQAGWTAFELASHAGVSLSTVNRMESGDPKKAVTRLVAYKVLNALSEKLGQRFTPEQVEGLQLK